MLYYNQMNVIVAYLTQAYPTHHTSPHPTPPITNDTNDNTALIHNVTSHDGISVKEHPSPTNEAVQHNTPDGDSDLSKLFTLQELK
jgi:hypothetical protein